MGELDQFAKDTFALETPAVTHGAMAWQLPPEVGLHEVRLDGLIGVLEHAPLLELAAPWCLVGEASELVIEIKMQGDHLDLCGFDRGMLRRLARQIQRREDPNERFDGEEPMWFITSRVSEIIRERRTLARVAPGCYRVGPEWLGTIWVAANELPLVDELVPFLIARTGRSLDEFVRWVKTRRSIDWLIRVLQYLPMSTAAYDELHVQVFAKTSDPEVRARQHMILEWSLEAFPEEREKFIEKGIEQGELLRARAAVREVLEARGLALQVDEAAQIETCTSLETLSRWHKQAVVAASTADALR